MLSRVFKEPVIRNEDLNSIKKKNSLDAVRNGEQQTNDVCLGVCVC